MLERSGSRARRCEALVDERLVAAGGAAARDLQRRRRGAGARDRDRPRVPGDGHFIGGDEIRRRLELQGVSEEEFEQSLRQRICCARASRPCRDRRRAGERRRGGARVPPAQRAGEGSSTCRSTPRASSAGRRADRRRGEGALRGEADGYKLPEQRVLSYVLLDRPTLQPRVTVTDARARGLLQRRTATSSSQPEEVCASHILVKVKARPDATEGHPDAEAQGARADGARPGQGRAPTSRRSRRRCPRTRARRAQGGDLGCFAPGRMVPEFDERGLRAASRARSRSLVKTQLRLPRHPARLEQGRRRCRRSPRSRSASARACSSARSSSSGEQKVQALADALAHSKTLEDAAKAQGLTVQKSAPFARGAAPPARLPDRSWRAPSS